MVCIPNFNYITSPFSWMEYNAEDQQHCPSRTRSGRELWDLNSCCSVRSACAGCETNVRSFIMTGARNVLSSEASGPSGTVKAAQMGETPHYTRSLSLKSTALFLCGFNLLPFMSGVCVCVILVKTSYMKGETRSSSKELIVHKA